MKIVRVTQLLANNKIEILVDQYGYSVYAYDYVIVENNEQAKIFLIKYSPNHLAFGFVTVDKQEKFYTLDELKTNFAGKCTFTKIGL